MSRLSITFLIVFVLSGILIFSTISAENTTNTTSTPTPSPTTPCTDSDGGTNSNVKGTATGIYSGAAPTYHAIYGQEPDPNTPKSTTNQYSTYIDHCSWDPSQLNEGFCDSTGKLSSIGIKCPNGCKDGICVSASSGTCVNGAIPGNGACICNGVSYNTGYCCNSVYSSSIPCSTTAPQCTEGAVPSSGCICSGYAYTSGYCCKSGLQSGLVWAGNTPCTQTCPTIAKNVNPSYSGVCCGGSLSDCKGTWSGQWGIDCQGYTCCIGTAQPLCTGNAYGDGAPSPSPTPAINKQSCEANKQYWCDTYCSSTQCPPCATNNLYACKTQETCKSAGGNWCGSYCVQGYCSSPTPTPAVLAVCNSTYILGCSTQQSCASSGGSWCKTSSSTYACQVGSCGGCFSPTPWNCNTESECKSIGQKWCGSSCQFQSLSCTDIATPAAQSPPVSTPAKTATPQPTETPFIRKEPPSVSCNTDQDCSWLITNGCSESTGANWACSSLIGPLQKSQGVCYGTLSPQPSANCGCIQNRCLAYADKKPPETPKKIGNTSIDSTTLLSAVIQIEQLKVKFDFLKAATEKLSKYYNLTGKSIQAGKWSTASDMLDQAILKLDSLKEDIRSKISSFTIDDLKELKMQIKSVIGTIREIVKTVI